MCAFVWTFFLTLWHHQSWTQPKSLGHWYMSVRLIIFLVTQTEWYSIGLGSGQHWWWPHGVKVYCSVIVYLFIWPENVTSTNSCPNWNKKRFLQHCIYFTWLYMLQNVIFYCHIYSVVDVHIKRGQSWKNWGQLVCEYSPELRQVFLFLALKHVSSHCEHRSYWCSNLLFTRASQSEETWHGLGVSLFMTDDALHQSPVRDH